jgi:guanylate kinase
VGKDSVIDGLKKLGRPYHFTVTATTRAMREDRRGREKI